MQTKWYMLNHKVAKGKCVERDFSQNLALRPKYEV